MDEADSRRDPVLQRLLTASLPFIYDQDTYVDAGAGDLWETQAFHGFRTGISMSLHMPGGRQFLFGVDRDRPLPTDDRRDRRPDGRGRSAVVRDRAGRLVRRCRSSVRPCIRRGGVV